jgi:hypothetical protein
MKKMNLKRWRNYHGRWETLIDSCTECFNEVSKKEGGKTPDCLGLSVVGDVLMKKEGGCRATDGTARQ